MNKSNPNIQSNIMNIVEYVYDYGDTALAITLFKLAIEK